MNITTCRAAVTVTVLWLATTGCQMDRAGMVADNGNPADSALGVSAVPAKPDTGASEVAAPAIEIRSDLELGLLPERWRTGGPDCTDMPRWQVHEYNPDFYILRQSGCVHYEKPFLYLIFGEERALLSRIR